MCDSWKLLRLPRLTPARLGRTKRSLRPAFRKPPHLEASASRMASLLGFSWLMIWFRLSPRHDLRRHPTSFGDSAIRSSSVIIGSLVQALPLKTYANIVHASNSRGDGGRGSWTEKCPLYWPMLSGGKRVPPLYHPRDDDDSVREN